MKQIYNTARQAIVEALDTEDSGSIIVQNILQLYDEAKFTYIDPDCGRLVSDISHYTKEPLIVIETLNDIELVHLVVDGPTYCEDCDYVVFLISNMLGDCHILLSARSLVKGEEIKICSLYDNAALNVNESKQNEFLDYMLRTAVGPAQYALSVLTRA